MKIAKALKIVAINLIIILILLEGGLFLAAQLGLLRMDLPSYSFAKVKSFWLDKDPNFGVWHVPNGRYLHRKSCFEVLYRTNSHGMRNAEAAFKAEEDRVVVLGDSFIEGYGVADESVLTAVLGRETGIPHLNFGTSRHFGLTQSWLLYKTLASQFDHKAVIISVLPDNDFTDDDISKGKKLHPGRYRPYLIGEYPNYTVKYYDESNLYHPDSVINFANSFAKYAKIWFNEFFYVVKTYDYLKAYFAIVNDGSMSATGRKNARDNPDSRYFDFSKEEFDRMKYALERIVAEAAPRPVLVIAIPRRSDYSRALAEAKEPPLTQQLKALSKTANFTYMDLLERTKNEPDLDKLFLSCDPHWGREGHQTAARNIETWDYYARSARK